MPFHSTFTHLAVAVMMGSVAMAAAARAQQGQVEQHPGQYAQGDVRRGSTLYQSHCVTCHGPNGDAVGSVDLRRGRFRNAASDEALAGLLKTGIPGAGMPPFNFGPEDSNAMVAFIRAGFDVNARAVKVGNPTRGQALFEGKGACSTCHRINGNGPRSAPDLSDIGAVRGAEALQGSLLDPSAFMVPINRPIRAVTRDGKIISGRRLNEDSYTVQLISDKEQLVSLDKSSLREYEIIKTSPMSSYKDKLSAEELADLVAYLLSLKG